MRSHDVSGFPDKAEKRKRPRSYGPEVETESFEYFDELDNAVLVDVCSESEDSELSDAASDESEKSAIALGRAQSKVDAWVPPWAEGTRVGFVLGLSSLQVQSGSPSDWCKRSLAKPKLVPLAKAELVEEAEDEFEPQSRKPRRHVRRRRMVHKDSTELRQNAMLRWAAMIVSVGFRFLESCQWLEGDLMSTIELLVTGRSTATVAKRGADFSPLVSYSLAKPQWPPTEQTIVEFLKAASQKGTKAQSTMSSINFAIYVMGFRGLHKLSKSLLLCGLVRRGLESLGFRKQSLALTFPVVQAVELCLEDPSFLQGCSVVVAYTLRYLLLVIALRSRHVDTATFQGCYRNKGQIIGAVLSTKTANARSDRLRLSLVGPCTLLTGKDVLRGLDKLRFELGMDALEKSSLQECEADPIRWPLYPDSVDGVFQCRPASLACLNQRLKQALVMTGDADAAMRTQTSARACLVTECSTLSAETKAKLLGHKVPKERGSTRAYDRDRLFGLVRLVQKFLSEARAKLASFESGDQDEEVDITFAADEEVNELVAHDESVWRAEAEDDELRRETERVAEVTDSEEEQEVLIQSSGSGVGVKLSALSANFHSFDVEWIPKPLCGAASWVNVYNGKLHRDRRADPSSTVCGVHLDDNDKFRMLGSEEDSSSFEFCQRCHTKSSIAYKT